MWAKYLLPIGLCAALIFPVSAQAQDGLFEISGKHSDSKLDVGIAAVVRESYVGSGESSALVLPYLSGQHGRYFFNPALGAGIFAIKNDQFRLGASANLALGRDGEDTPFNTEAFDVDPTLTASTFGRIYLPFAAVDAIATFPVVGDLNGAKLDLLASTSVSPTTYLTITPGVRATYNSAGWINTNYGITPEQAASVSGLSALDLDGQFAALGVHAAAYLKISENYEVVGVFNHSILQGGAKDSPLTPENSGTTFAFGVVRKF